MKDSKNQAITNATASSSNTEDKSTNPSLDEKANQVVEILQSDKSEEEKESLVWDVIK